VRDVDGRHRSPQGTGIDRKANQGANEGNVLDLTHPFWKAGVAWQKRNGEIRIVLPLPAKKFRLNLLATDNPAWRRTDDEYFQSSQTGSRARALSGSHRVDVSKMSGFGVLPQSELHEALRSGRSSGCLAEAGSGNASANASSVDIGCRHPRSLSFWLENWWPLQEQAAL